MKRQNNINQPGIVKSFFLKGASTIALVLSISLIANVFTGTSAFAQQNKPPNILLTPDSSGPALQPMKILEPGQNIRIARALPATSLASDPRFLNR